MCSIKEGTSGDEGSVYRGREERCFCGSTTCRHFLSHSIRMVYASPLVRCLKNKRSSAAAEHVFVDPPFGRALSMLFRKAQGGPSSACNSESLGPWKINVPFCSSPALRGSLDPTCGLLLHTTLKRRRSRVGQPRKMTPPKKERLFFKHRGKGEA